MRKSIFSIFIPFYKRMMNYRVIMLYCFCKMQSFEKTKIYPVRHCPRFDVALQTFGQFYRTASVRNEFHFIALQFGSRDISFFRFCANRTRDHVWNGNARVATYFDIHIFDCPLKIEHRLVNLQIIEHFVSLILISSMKIETSQKLSNVGKKF